MSGRLWLLPAVAVALSWSGHAVSGQTAYSLPSPIMTPGAVDISVTIERICNESTKKRRRVPTSRCDAVFRAFSIQDTLIDRYSFECDHLVPLATQLRDLLYDCIVRQSQRVERHAANSLAGTLALHLESGDTLPPQVADRRLPIDELVLRLPHENECRTR